MVQLPSINGCSSASSHRTGAHDSNNASVCGIPDLERARYARPTVGAGADILTTAKARVDKRPDHRSLSLYERHAVIAGLNALHCLDARYVEHRRWGAGRRWRRIWLSECNPNRP